MYFINFKLVYKEKHLHMYYIEILKKNEVHTLYIHKNENGNINI